MGLRDSFFLIFFFNLRWENLHCELLVQARGKAHCHRTSCRGGLLRCRDSGPSTVGADSEVAMPMGRLVDSV